MRPLKKLSMDVLDSIGDQVSGLSGIDSHSQSMPKEMSCGANEKGGGGFTVGNTCANGGTSPRKNLVKHTDADRERMKKEIEAWEKRETPEGKAEAIKQIDQLRMIIGEAGEIHTAKTAKDKKVWRAKRKEAKKLVDGMFDISPDYWMTALRMYKANFPPDVEKGRVVKPINEMSTTRMSSSWVQYEGPRDGSGWKHSSTGEVRYQDEQPEDGAAKVSSPADGELSSNKLVSRASIELQEGVSPEEFVKARDRSEMPGFLSMTGPDDIRHHTLFLSKDGTAGVALSPDGDLQNVFNNGGQKGDGVRVILAAIRSGKVSTGDCYDGYLNDLYHHIGFRESGRMRFSKEYAPEGWDYDKYGEPDVVFLALTEPMNEEEVMRLVATDRDDWSVIMSKKYFKGEHWNEAKIESRRAHDAAYAAKKKNAGRGGAGTGVVDGPGTDDGRHSEGEGRPERSDGRGVRSSGQSGDSGVREGSHAGPVGNMKSIPSTVNVPGKGPVEFGFFQKARDAASRYMKSSGMRYDQPMEYVKVDPDRGRRIAVAYDKMKHDPENHRVKKAFDLMFRETAAQWNEIEKTGLKISFIEPGMPDPYEASPRLAMMDVKDNNHLWVYASSRGFGSSDDPSNRNNPGLNPSGVSIDGRELSNVELFRIVHDYFGHIKEGIGFRAGGEENAWRVHSAMFSPLARHAMTAATRGQNSWVNFGPHGERNRKAMSGDTVYADQKVGLMPGWVTREGLNDTSVEMSLWAKYTTHHGDRGWRHMSTGEVRVQVVNPGVRMSTNLDVKIGASGLPSGATATQRASKIFRGVPDGYVVAGLSGNDFIMAVNVQSHFRAICEAMELMTGQKLQTKTNKSILSVIVPVDALRRIGQERFPRQFQWARGVEFQDIARYLLGSQPRF